MDVLRATSTIAQALDGGYRRVLCCAGIEEAIAWCARENALVVVPRLGGMEGSAAEIVVS